MVCKTSFFVIIFIYFVLTKAMLFIALRYAYESDKTILAACALFEGLLLFSVPFIVNATEGFCLP